MSGQHMPDPDRDPDAHALWRHTHQMGEMHRRFPTAAALLPPCELCGLDAAGHAGGVANSMAVSGVIGRTGRGLSVHVCGSCLDRFGVSMDEMRASLQHKYLDLIREKGRVRMAHSIMNRGVVAGVRDG